jgi:hypothetical protein
MIAAILGQAGVKPPLPSRQDETLTLPIWHERVLEAVSKNQSVEFSQHHPGKLWEHLASGIFLDNMHAPLWVWADSRSVWLLDFWQRFEPALYFLLVYTSPQRALAAALSSKEAQSVDVATVLQDWQSHHQEILRFHHRNPARTMLIDAAQCAANPDALIRACAARWALDLHAASAIAPILSLADPLAAYLAEQLRATQPQSQALQNELEASVHVLEPGGAGSSVLPTAFSLDDAVNHYFGVQAKALQSIELVDQLSIAAVQRQAMTVRVDDLEAQVVRLNTVQLEKQAQLHALEQTARHSQQQNEVLRRQLHQVMAELEQLLAEANSLRDKVAGQRQENSELTADLLRKTDDHGVVASGLAQQRDAVRQQCNKLEQLVQEKEKKLAEYQSRLAQSDRSVQAAAGAINESQQTSEVLLLELRHVQEELECYFLQYQIANEKNLELDASWQRMFARNPGYCDYQSLDVLQVDGSGAGQSVTWRLVNVHAAGRLLPELRFRTVIQNGVAGFIFTREADKLDASLLRWPLNHATKSEVLITLPTATDATAVASIQMVDTLLDLSSSDWDLLHALCHLLNDALDADSAPHIGGGGRLSDALDANALRVAVNHLLHGLETLPAVARFDRLILKREQVNPDYEHLWFQFGNIRFGQRGVPLFEFRLSCANVRPGKFGSNPKLEFPVETGQGLFDSWFEEACDDFGGKLELRFALPSAMDLNVWQMLSAHDHDLICSLANRLPSILGRLDQLGVRLARAWADWQALAVSVQSVLWERVDKVTPDPTAFTSESESLKSEPVHANSSSIMKSTVVAK